MLKLDKRRQIFYDKKAVSELNKERWKKLAQKAGDKIRQGSLRLAMLMTTLIGNGSATGSNPPAESSSSSEKTTITAPAVKTERADSIDTVDMTQLMSEQLISSNKNIAGNFNLEGRTFTAEELAEIGQCELNEQIQKTAQKTDKRGVPKKGQQTYCLGAVKSFFAKHGITIDAQRFAYRAVTGFQANENFTEVEAEMNNFRSLPDGAVIAWEKGTTRYGHVAMKIGNKEFCDFVYNLRTHNRRGSSGQRYGKPHVFILKNMPFSKKLTQKLIAEGRLDKSLEKQTLALVKIGDMRMLLNADNLAAFNHDLAKAGIRTADKMTLKDLKKHEKEQQRLTAEILRERRQRD